MAETSPLSIDTEDTGVDFAFGSRPFLITTCVLRQDPVYWEWFCTPETREPSIPQEDLEEIADLFSRYDRFVLQNGKFDAHALDSVGFWDLYDVEEFFAKAEDTLIAGHVLASNLPHNLTDMLMQYTGIDIEPYEVRMKEATTEARRIARKEYPTWALAKEGRADMPSCKADKKKREKGAEDESPWKLDTFLPRLIARKKGYRVPDLKCRHVWKPLPEWTCRKCKGHSWWVDTSRYANTDSEGTGILWVKQERLLHEKGLWKIYRDRLKLSGVVFEMERRGVTLRKSRHGSLSTQYRAESEALGAKCVAVADKYDYKLDLPAGGNNNSLLHFCFGKPIKEEATNLVQGKIEYLKLPVAVRTEAGAPSLNKEAFNYYTATLTRGTDHYEFVESLRDKRKRDSAVSYLDGYRRFWRMVKGDVYRLYPSLNITGTGTLRFSSSNPNSQNIGKGEEECRRCLGDGCEVCDHKGVVSFNIRRCFCPAPGREWWSMDYENIELRIPAYASNERSMIELFERPNDPPYFGSYHLLNASIVFPEKFWPLAETKGAFKKRYASEEYQWIKNFDFSLSYQAGRKTADRAARRQGAYDAVKSMLKEHTRYNEETCRFADRHGYVETIPDREVDPTRGYPVMCTRGQWDRISPTIPLSYKIQSTAMHCTAKAMVRCDEQLREWRRDGFDAWMDMQVHDELKFDLPAGGRRNLPRIKKLQRLMEQSGDDIGIPLKVSVSYHPVSWGEDGKLT